MPDKPDIFNDWTHEFPCGCKVTWLGSVWHKSRRMDCCARHNGRANIDMRNRMQEEATGHYELAMMGGKPPPRFKDMGDHPEDERIDLIGKKAMEGHKVAFITDADPGKADRYIAKLLTKFPALVVFGRFDGPVAGSVTVKVCLKELA